MNVKWLPEVKFLNEYRIIEYIWSYWMNIELLNKCEVIEWI